MKFCISYSILRNFQAWSLNWFSKKLAFFIISSPASPNFKVSLFPIISCYQLYINQYLKLQCNRGQNQQLFLNYTPTTVHMLRLACFCDGDRRYVRQYGYEQNSNHSAARIFYNSQSDEGHFHQVYHCQHDPIAVDVPTAAIQDYCEKESQLNYAANESFDHYPKNVDLFQLAQGKEVELSSPASVADESYQKDEQIDAFVDADDDEPRLEVHQSEQFLADGAVGLRDVQKPEVAVHEEEGHHHEDGHQVDYPPLFLGFDDLPVQLQLLLVLDLKENVLVDEVLIDLRGGRRDVEARCLQNFVPDVGLIGIVSKFTNQVLVDPDIFEIQGVSADRTSFGPADGDEAEGTHLVLPLADEQRDSGRFVIVVVADIAENFVLGVALVDRR